MLVIFPIFDIDVTLLYHLIMEIYSSRFDLFIFVITFPVTTEILLYQS